MLYTSKQSNTAGIGFIRLVNIDTVSSLRNDKPKINSITWGINHHVSNTSTRVTCFFRTNTPHSTPTVSCAMPITDRRNRKLSETVWLQFDTAPAPSSDVCFIGQTPTKICNVCPRRGRWPQNFNNPLTAHI